MGNNKSATCFATLLQIEYLICCKTGLNIGCKMCNIGILPALQ